MSRPARLALAALALAACADPAPPADGAGGVADAPAAAPLDAAPDTLAITTQTRELAERPAPPLRVDGACPFEGCTYGTWTTSAETTVYGRGGDSTSAAFMVPAGTRLDASGGFALLTRVGASVATRPTDLLVPQGEAAPLALGDTVLVLDYEGEGSFRVWHGGRIGFSDAGGNPGAALRQATTPEQQWWARVAAPDGRAGWLWMDRTPGVAGADAFAAP
ncbi:hypothetical protein RQM47_04100 [Rubrivirga sp. S365]|uniref:hypothetical protein n=1 Tax=Rubrivirga sp. S365 TaxID=3076080 RepID=UPI0028C5ECC9|nr:hypothetical protein [Rubrivirga sp. S365]MDT7855817.1 hypothetical protein [Rubrivirga sp. S365]